MTVTEPHHSPGPVSDHPTLRDALALLDSSAATPGDRSAALSAVDTLLAATVFQDAGLLDEIRRTEPRLADRVADLGLASAQLATQAQALRDRLLRPPGPDAKAVRRGLVDLARAVRRHQSAESDLIFDALNTDLGVGD